VSQPGSAGPDDDEILEAVALGEENPAEVHSSEKGFEDANPGASGAPGEQHPDAVEGELIDVGFDGEPTEEEFFVDGTLGRSDLAAERDEFREAFMRVKADFENFKKRSDKNLNERVERATGQLVTQLLVVLDSCDAAVGQGVAEVEPIQKALLELLEREGLERLDPVGEAFDPNLHEAVMHEEGDGGEEPTVIASLRIGYAWKGKVIRPAMVKVLG